MQGLGEEYQAQSYRQNWRGSFRADDRLTKSASLSSRLLARSPKPKLTSVLEALGMAVRQIFIFQNYEIARRANISSRSNLSSRIKYKTERPFATRFASVQSAGKTFGNEWKRNGATESQRIIHRLHIACLPLFVGAICKNWPIHNRI